MRPLEETVKTGISHFLDKMETGKRGRTEAKRLGIVRLSVCDMEASGRQIYELISFPNMI